MNKIKILKKLDKILNEYKDWNRKNFNQLEEGIEDNIQSLTKCENREELGQKLNEIIHQIKRGIDERRNEFKYMMAFKALKQKVGEMKK